MALERLRQVLTGKPKPEKVVTTETEPPTRKVFAVTEDAEAGAADRLLTMEKLVRRDPEELERIYFLDQTVFQGINMVANHITAPGYTLDGGDEEGQTKVKEFFQKIGFLTTLNCLVRHSLIFGNAYGEIVYNKFVPPTKIVDFVTIDPKSIDLIRDLATGIPKFDEDGNILGFIQKDLMNKQKRFTQKDLKQGHFPKIIYFPLYGLSLGHKGIGLIEPLYKSEKIKLNLEHSFGEVAFRVGMPIIWAKLGDEFHHPTDDQLQAFGEQLKGMHTKNQLVTDRGTQIELIQPKDISPLENVLNYFKGNVSSGMGVPELLLYGSGAGVNRATSQVLLEQFFRNIMTLQGMFAEKIQLLVKRFCEVEKIENVPRFAFKDPRPQRLNELAIRLERYTGKALLTPSATLENYLRELENLPVEPKASAAKKVEPTKEPKEVAKDPDRSAIEDELARDLEKGYERLVKKTVETLHKFGR